MICSIILRHAEHKPDSLALHYVDDRITYAELGHRIRAAAAMLEAEGFGHGDCIAFLGHNHPSQLILLLACAGLGCLLLPLNWRLAAPELREILEDSGAALLFAMPEMAALAREAAPAGCPVRDAAANWPEQKEDPSRLQLELEDMLLLIYTSGTTGAPKGALLPQSALLGNLTGFVASQNWFPQEGDVFWSPADWAWTGGLMDALLPTLYFGRPIIAYNGRFSPELAFTLMQEHGVTHTFLFPTALKAMMKAYPQPRKQFRLKLQAIMSAGEAVGDAVFAYCRDQLGVVVNEMFGQTEINYVVGNCSMNGAPSNGRGWPARPGSMGRPYPGHRVAVIDDDGNECAPDVPGDVAVNRFDVHGDPDPIFFLGYWKNEDATRAKFTGDWCRTGDLATRDADGYLWYQGRADDVFKAAGYRIGPSEIENCLVKHPAVGNAAVVPKPDPERGNIVKAYIVPTPGTPRGAEAEAKLIAELQDHVRGKLAPYEYPKEIEFIDELPMTTTGKVQRRVLRLREQERSAAQA